MGFNLADAFAGGLQGLGQGLAQQGDAMEKRSMLERTAQLTQQREEAMARLNSTLSTERDQTTYDRQAPDRAFDQGIRTRTTDANIAHLTATEGVARDTLTETGRHNKASEGIQANNTEARIQIAEMQAENRRIASSLRDAEKAAQLPKEQIEYLKGFSVNRGKVLSDTLMPDAEKQKALAALDADLYANYPPAIARNESGQYRTQDVLGRTRVFNDEKALAAAGFAKPSGGASGASTGASSSEAPVPKAKPTPQPGQAVQARARAGDPQAQAIMQKWQDEQDALRQSNASKQLRNYDVTEEEMQRASKPAFNLFPTP